MRKATATPFLQNQKKALIFILLNHLKVDQKVSCMATQCQRKKQETKVNPPFHLPSEDIKVLMLNQAKGIVAFQAPLVEENLPKVEKNKNNSANFIFQ
jgi:hypothetical protein